MLLSHVICNTWLCSGMYNRFISQHISQVSHHLTCPIIIRVSHISHDPVHTRLCSGMCNSLIQQQITYNSPVWCLSPSRKPCKHQQSDKNIYIYYLFIFIFIKRKICAFQRHQTVEMTSFTSHKQLQIKLTYKKNSQETSKHSGSANLLHGWKQSCIWKKFNLLTHFLTYLQ